MKAALCLLVAAALGGALRASDLAPLTPALAAGEWQPLLHALASKGSVQADFTERRYFPFRTQPTVLHGVMRISRAHGLSLQYTGDDPSVLIADPGGLVIRDSGGSRELAATSHQGAAIALLLPILRFDFDALFPRFEIQGQRRGPDWRLEFAPRDPEVARTLGLITVVGTDDDVRHLQFRHSASQRVDIDVDHVRGGVSFTPAEMQAYFR